MRDALCVTRRIAAGRRMILLRVAQAAMAIAADNDQSAVVPAASDVMKLQRQRVIAGAKNAPRIVRTQSFERLLPATLTFQFVIVHGSIPSNDDAVDVFEALVVRRSEPIERVGAGLERVRSSGDVSDAHTLELAQPSRVVGPQEVAHGRHEAADF